MKRYKGCSTLLITVILSVFFCLILYMLGDATFEKDSCLNNYFEGVTDRDYSFESGCKLKYKGEWMTLKEYNDNYGFWSKR